MKIGSEQWDLKVILQVKNASAPPGQITLRSIDAPLLACSDKHRKCAEIIKLRQIRKGIAQIELARKGDLP